LTVVENFFYEEGNFAPGGTFPLYVTAC